MIEFRILRKEEIYLVFEMIKKRVEWMEQNNIKQWSKAYYEEIYPLSYYEEECLADHVYGLIDNKTNIILASAVILKEDTRWPDLENALYVHNLVTRNGYTGIGKIFIKKLEELAKSNGVNYLRLDCSIYNDKLNKYYDNLGFIKCGTCVEGDYQGFLRQIKLK